MTLGTWRVGDFTGWQEADWIVLMLRRLSAMLWEDTWHIMALYGIIWHDIIILSTANLDLSSDKYKTASQVPVDGCKWCTPLLYSMKDMQAV